MARVQTILVPTDFSGASRSALVVARRMAKSGRTVLTILHVVWPATSRRFLDTAIGDQIAAQERKWAAAELARMAAQARIQGLDVRTMLLTGDPARRIVAAATRLQADFVVMGARGQTRFSKLAPRGVAARVIATSSCPVVTVREA